LVAVTATLAPIDLVWIYLLPVAALTACWLGLSALVLLLVRAPVDSDVKHDLRRKFEDKRRLRSGEKLRLSFPYVAKLLIGDNCVQAAVLYRLSRFCVRHRLGPLADAIHAFAKFATGLDVNPRAEIGPGVYFYHGLGAVIGKGTRIGARALICQGVTTGGGPTIGDDVKLWAGAKVLGRVTIGDRAEAGANAVVIDDVPPDTIAVGIPADRLMPAGGTGSRPRPHTTVR
jgi:serine O-acetyltransferase